MLTVIEKAAPRALLFSYNVIFYNINNQLDYE